jgi:peptide/nickel transport system permease protein
MQEAQRQSGGVEALDAVLARRSSRGFLPLIWRFVQNYPLGGAGALLLLILVLVAIFAPQLATHDPLVQDIPNRLEGPGSQFWLGTDTFGRDSYSRIIYGSRISLRVGLLAVTMGTLIGTILGIMSGYLGGKFDLLIQRLVDAFMGFPSLILAMIMVVALGASLNNVTLAIGIVLIPRMVRLSRSSALSVKEEVYITASQAVGASVVRTMLRHVLPNSLAPVFVLATGYLGTAIVSEASLSFLGLGVPPPAASWGGMLEVGTRGYLETAPWLAIYPGIALSLVVFAFSFFGDALRDAFDPRLRGR